MEIHSQLDFSRVHKRLQDINRAVFARLRLPVFRENPLVESYMCVKQEVAGLFATAHETTVANLADMRVSWVRVRPELRSQLETSKNEHIPRGVVFKEHHVCSDDETYVQMRVREMNLLVLSAVRDIGATRSDLAQSYFGLDRETLEILCDASLDRIIAACNQPIAWTVLYAGNNLFLWRLLLQWDDRHWNDINFARHLYCVALQLNHCQTSPQIQRNGESKGLLGHRRLNAARLAAVSIHL